MRLIQLIVKRLMQIAWVAMLFAFVFVTLHAADTDPLQFPAAIAATFIMMAAICLSVLYVVVSVFIRSSKRFSLRTLLIATTLVAVVLGLIVAAI
jgi:hypothetical protein